MTLRSFHVQMPAFLHLKILHEFSQVANFEINIHIMVEKIAVFIMNNDIFS